MYFDDEYQPFEFPPDILKDFTIVDDGHVIGITIAVHEDDLHAEWYFNDAERKGKYLAIRDKLLGGCIKLPDLKRWWKEERDRNAAPREET